VSEQSVSASLREQKKIETRRTLARAAAELLLSEGSDGMTVAAVAQRAGVSTRTFHNYFPRREDALITFIENTISQWCSEAKQAPAEESPLQVMHRLISDRVSDDDDAETDPGTLVNLISIGDHLSYVAEREERDRVEHLADDLLEVLYLREGHSLSRQATALLMVSSLAAGAIAVKATRKPTDTHNCALSWATDTDRSACEILEDGFSLLRSGFGGEGSSRWLAGECRV